jgi:hypothetical protein
VAHRFSDGGRESALGNDNYTGSAYVFTRAGDGSWSQVQKLRGADGTQNDVFGVSVAVSGDTALIGAYNDDDNGEEYGAISP